MKLSFSTPVILAAVLLLSIACASSAAPTPTAQPKSAVTAAPAVTPTTKPAEAATPAATKPAAAATPTTAPKPAATTLEKVKIHIPSRSTSVLELYLAKDLGIFKEEGIDLEIVMLQSSLGVPALEKGDVDYTTLFGSTLRAAVKGEPVRVVMGTKTNNTWRLFAKQGVTTAQQIAGQPIAVSSREGTGSYALTKSIKSLGLDPSNNPLVVITSQTEMLAGLKSGSIGGASLVAPESYRAEAEGYKELVNSANIVEVPVLGLAATVKKIQENPDQVKRVMAAYLKGITYMRDHKEETIQYAMKEFSLDRQLAELSLKEEVSLRSQDGSISNKGLTTQVEIMQAEAGAETTSLDTVRKGLDLTLLPDVQKRLGLSR